MFNNLIPIIVLFYFFYHLKNTSFNNILSGLIFVSFFIFATNYSNYGLDFDIFRYLHRFIGVVVVIALLFYILKNKINFLKDSIPKILLIFFLVLLLSFLDNDVYVEYYVHYIRNFIFIAFIATYLFYSLDSEVKLEELFSLIIAISLILSGFVLLELIQPVIFNEGGLTWEGRSRLYFGNANYLAYTLLPGSILALFSNNKIYGRIAALIIAIAIFASGSRAVELSICIALAVHLFYFKYKVKYLVPFISILILIFTLFFETIVTNHNYSNVRYVLAKISFNILRENPINGIGYGQFKKSFHEYVNQDIIDMNNSEVNEVYFANQPNSMLNINMSKDDIEDLAKYGGKEKMTHNDLLTIISELGFLGILFTVYIFYKLYIELQKLLLHNRRYFFLSIGLISGSLIFSLFHNNLTSFVFWFILFIPFIMNRNYKKQLKE